MAKSLPLSHLQNLESRKGLDMSEFFVQAGLMGRKFTFYWRITEFTPSQWKLSHLPLFRWAHGAYGMQEQVLERGECEMLISVHQSCICRAVIPPPTATE